MLKRGGVTAPRIVVANGTFAITRRTAFRKLFWTPSDPLVARGFLYALADAQQKHDVEVHHGILLPTHLHVTVTPRKDNLPEFMRHLHRESARFLQEYLLARGYDAPENVWDSRSAHTMRLLGPGAQLEWVLYEHLNAVAAGLVERASDYPGWTSDLGLLKGGLVGVTKAPLYYGKHKSEELPVRYTAPPVLARAFDGDLDALVYWMRRTVRDMEDAYRDERRAKGMGVVGAAKIKRTHPFAEPRTPRERRGRLVPTFKIGQLGDEDEARELRKHCAGERRRFLSEHRESYLMWRGGERTVSFPAGEYGMRVFHGASVAGPASDAVLCVGDDLDAVEVASAEARREMFEAVREAVRADGEEDAEPLAELADSTDGARPAGANDAPSDVPPGPDEPPTPPPSRPPAHAMPLASPSLTAQIEHPARITTLRTRLDRGPPE